ncbi:MAG: hypothetical protein U0X39_12830 [Bacteroidales bacterium]
MKSILLFTAAIFTSTFLSGQTVDNQTQKLVGDFVRNNTDVRIEPVDNVATGKVFTGTFYKLIVGFIETGVGSSDCGDANYVNINGSNVKMAEPVHMDLECPVLLSIVKKDFLLKDENAAKLFEAAMNVIYPFDEKEKANVKHMKKGTQWIFLRGKFFDDYTAFIVTTAANGTITKIDLKLSYPVN